MLHGEDGGFNAGNLLDSGEGVSEDRDEKVELILDGPSNEVLIVAVGAPGSGVVIESGLGGAEVVLEITNDGKETVHLPAGGVGEVCGGGRKCGWEVERVGGGTGGTTGKNLGIDGSRRIGEGGACLKRGGVVGGR
jgi:hypothetical protein